MSAVKAFSGPSDEKFKILNVFRATLIVALDACTDAFSRVVLILLEKNIRRDWVLTAATAATDISRKFMWLVGQYFGILL